AQPDWPTVIVINHYQAPQITAGQSGCDTQPDVPTLTCAPGAHHGALEHLLVKRDSLTPYFLFTLCDLKNHATKKTIAKVQHLSSELYLNVWLTCSSS
ncbi:hypothetical protein Tco_1433624, partial [Tanacetum coccineum]